MCFPEYIKFAFHLQNDETPHNLRNSIPHEEPNPIQKPKDPAPRCPKIIQDVFASLTAWEATLESLEDFIERCAKQRYQENIKNPWMNIAAVNLLAGSSKKCSENILLSLRACADYFDKKGDQARREDFWEIIEGMSHMFYLESRAFGAGKEIIKLLRLPIYYGEAEEKDLKWREVRDKKEDFLYFLRALKDMEDELVSRLEAILAGLN